MESQSSWKKRLGDESFWLRLPFMLLFFFAWKLAELILIGVILIQIVVHFVLGQPVTALQALGAQLSRYTYQVFRYLTFNSEQKPFPFADWPSDERADPDPYQPLTTEDSALNDRPKTDVE